MDEFRRFGAEDAELLKRTEAKNRLESSVLGLKSKLYDKKDGIEEADYDQLMEVVEEMSDWMDENGDTAEYDDFVEKQRELDEIIAPMFAGFRDSESGDQDYYDHEDL